MISALQVQAYRATGNMKYLDLDALTVATYLDELQQSNGLFYHAEDSPFFWGRGNGWVAAGMTELLSELQENHPIIYHRYNRPGREWSALIILCSYMYLNVKI